MVIFDDYGWDAYQDQPKMYPKLSVDFSLEVFQDRIRILYKGYQVIVEKAV